ADAILTARGTYDDKVLYHQWRNGETVTLLVVRCCNIPHYMSSLSVKCHDMSIECPAENLIAEDGKPAVHSPATRPNVPGQLTVVLPDWPARARIQSKHTAVLGCAVEDSVYHQRSGFKSAVGAVSWRTGLVNPLGDKSMTVLSVDLIQSAEAMCGIIT